jgi:hypothetical protein
VGLLPKTLIYYLFIFCTQSYNIVFIQILMEGTPLRYDLRGSACLYQQVNVPIVVGNTAATGPQALGAPVMVARGGLAP